MYARNNWFWSCVWASNACGVVESVLALLFYRPAITVPESLSSTLISSKSLTFLSR